MRLHAVSDNEHTIYIYYQVYKHDLFTRAIIRKINRNFEIMHNSCDRSFHVEKFYYYLNFIII